MCKKILVYLLITSPVIAHGQIDRNTIQSDMYTWVKYNFYTDASGELFEKKMFAVDDLRNEGRSYYDSTLFYPEYPKRVALKSMIDLDSFEEFKDTPFSKDKKYVYYVRGTSDGGQRFIIRNAKLKTFTPINDRWSRDERNVYWENNVVKGVDLVTFRVDEADPNSATDKNWVYVNGERAKKNNR